MEEQYPLWLRLQLFLDLSAENGINDVPIWEYFRILSCDPPPSGGFSEIVFVAENLRPSCPSSRSYWRPLKKLSTIAFCCNFVGIFFKRTRPWHHHKTEQPKNCQSEQDVDQFLYSAMDGRKYQNKHHGDTVPKKNARHVFMFSSDQYKKCTRRGSVLQATFVPHSASSRVILIG